MMKTPKYKKVLFVPDIHAPYHDIKAVKAMISFARWWKPDYVYFLGDVVDFYAISSFSKDPQRVLELQHEVDEAKKILKLICEATPNAKKYFIRGNHEARMQKFLWTRAAELSSLRSLQVETLLGFDELGITYYKDGRTKFRGTILKHGDIVRKFCCYTAKGEFENTGVSGVSAHTHRLGIYSMTNEAGDFVWMECGHLCDTKQEYLDGKVPNWQQGFGIGYYKAGSRRFHTDPIRIVKNKAMYNGYEFY
jgi:predicted phosphodiesterase